MSLVPPLPDLLSALDEVVGELVGLHSDLGNLLSAEHNNRTLAWFQADDDTDGRMSDKTRDRSAAYHTLDLSSEIFTTRAAIAAHIERRDHLQLQISLIQSGTV